MDKKYVLFFNVTKRDRSPWYKRSKTLQGISLAMVTAAHATQCFFLYLDSTRVNSRMDEADDHLLFPAAGIGAGPVWARERRAAGIRQLGPAADRRPLSWHPGAGRQCARGVLLSMLCSLPLFFCFVFVFLGLEIQTCVPPPVTLLQAQGHHHASTPTLPDTRQEGQECNVACTSAQCTAEQAPQGSLLHQSSPDSVSHHLPILPSAGLLLQVLDVYSSLTHTHT